MEIVTKDELVLKAREVKEKLESVPRGIGAIILKLSGELGAGKTTFTQALAECYGITEKVLSPTFILARVHDIENDARFTRLVHIDAYRLKNADELTTIGWDEYVKDDTTLIVLEWPEKVAEKIAYSKHAIVFTHDNEQTRGIEMNL